MTETKKTITSKSDQYEVIRKLGEGYTGEVFLVKDAKRKEPVALKLLNPEAFKEGQLEAFKREFILLSDLHHPHLCKVYDFGLSDSEQRYFFTSELIQGTDLYAYTDKLSIEEIEEISVQITDALGFIHAAGLIHFDIKGANILITTVQNKALAKVVDFGLAAPSIEVPEKIIGTIRYMSPEMITKNQTIDYRADLYSLGIVLYRMLAKTYPNQGNTMKDIINWHTKHTSIETAPLESQGAPKYLIDVIEKLTKTIPTERFSSAPVIIKYIELHSGRNYKKTQRELVATLTEEGPLVGRDRIMQKIRSNISKLSKKEPLDDKTNPTLILTGPHGIGKSRLLKETKYIAQLNEIQTIIINSKEEGQDIEVFKKSLGIATDKQGKDIIDAIAASQPLCLMIDDLDRCNQQVRDAVVGLSGLLYSSKFMGSPLPIYLMITMTTSGPKESLPIPLHLGVDEEHLSLFSEQEITQYIRSFLGESNPPVQQIKDIHQFSGGVPELVRVAIASLETSTSRLTRDTDKVFAELINQLSPIAKKLLGTLAIAEKPLTQLQMITLTGLTVESGLTELKKASLIQYNRETEAYQVATGAILAAATKSLTSEDSKEIAKRLLEYTIEEDPKDIDSIVKFASMGAAPDKLCDYLIEAARVKEERNEIDQAYNYYKKVLPIINEKDPRLPDIHRKLARYHILSSKFSDAAKHIDIASKSTRLTIEDFTSLSWIERLQHNPKGALKHIEEALNSPDIKQGEPEHLRLLNEEAHCYLQMGNLDDAAKKFGETHKKTQALPDELRKKVANNNLGLAYARQGKFDEAIKFYKEKYEYLKDDKRLAASILSQLGYVYQQAGLLDDALETSKKSWEFSSQMGDIHSAAAILGNIICLCQSKALYTDALYYTQESIKLASQAASEKDLAGNFLTIGTLYRTLGLEDVAEKYLTEAARLFQKLEDRQMDAWVQLHFAYLYKDTGRNKDALAHLENVIKQGKTLNDKELINWGYYSAAEVYLDIGNTEKAAQYIANIDVKWAGIEKAMENDIKYELLKCKQNVAEEKMPTKELTQRLEELAGLSLKQGLREVASEAYHTLGMLYQKSRDDLTSAKYVSKAKDIIDDIAGTLSEEYRDSFLRQQFRRTVSEDSVRLEQSISQLGLEDLGIKPEDIGLKEAPPKAKTKVPTPSEEPADKTIGLPEEQMLKTSALGLKEKPLSKPVIVGQSVAILKIKEIIERIKDSNIPVLIEGEIGVGKEHIAEMIRDEGVYRNRPWQKVDIAALPEEFLINDLFGGEREGVFELAGNGTVFLKHIDAMPQSLQKDLAKALKQKKYTRLRDKSELSLISRIIATSNIGTEGLIKERKFNKDLIKYLSGILISVPPLRKRREDIPLLIDHFLDIIASERNLAASYNIKTDALKTLVEYNWPGNARELEQVLKNACVLSKDMNITLEQIMVHLRK